MSILPREQSNARQGTARNKKAARKRLANARPRVPGGLARRCVGLPILVVAGLLIVYAFYNQLSYNPARNSESNTT